MTAAIADPGSALHASCVTMRAAGAELLIRAQAEGVARTDIDGGDLFALAGSLTWISDQPSLASRADRLLGVLASAILSRTERTPAHRATPLPGNRWPLTLVGAVEPLTTVRGQWRPSTTAVDRDRCVDPAVGQRVCRVRLTPASRGSGCWSRRTRSCVGPRRICRRRTCRENSVPSRP